MAEMVFTDPSYQIRSLPPEIRDHRLLGSLAVQIAEMVSETAYAEELSRLAALHGDDPRSAFLLLNYYQLQGDYEAAIAYAEAGQQAGPLNIDSQWALLTAYLAAQRFDDAVSTLITLETDFPVRMNIDRMASDELYAAFMHSPQFEVWSAGR